MELDIITDHTHTHTRTPASRREASGSFRPCQYGCRAQRLAVKAVGATIAQTQEAGSRGRIAGALLMDVIDSGRITGALLMDVATAGGASKACGRKHPRAPRISTLFEEERAMPAALTFRRNTQVGEMVSLAALGGRRVETSPAEEEGE